MSSKLSSLCHLTVREQIVGLAVVTIKLLNDIFISILEIRTYVTCQ